MAGPRRRAREDDLSLCGSIQLSSNRAFAGRRPSMGSVLGLLMSSLLLTSCRNDGLLTASECRTMAAYAQSELGQPVSDADVARCVAGRSYTRADYRCVMTAIDETATVRCLAVAGQRG